MKLNWNTCIKVGISVFVLYICIHFWPAVATVLGALLKAGTPMYIGCVIAYILSIPMTAFEMRFFPNSRKKAVIKLRRPLGILISFVLVLGIITAVIWLVVPQLISCVQLIFDELPGVFTSLVEWAKNRGLFSPETIGMLEEIDWASRIGQIAEMVTTGIGSVAEIVFALVSSVFSGVVTSVISMIFAVYLLMQKDALKRQYHALAKRYMKKKWIDRIDHAASVINDCFRRYIVGQCTEALILGVLCMIGMWALRLPYAEMVGALIAFTALIPVAGAFIGGAIGAFMILTVSPMKALIFLIFLIVLQQLENNIIYPKVVGTSLGLPALWVLAAVTVGGGVLGIGGMLIGVPLTAAIYRLLREDVHKNDPAPAEEEQSQDEQDRET